MRREGRVRRLHSGAPYELIVLIINTLICHGMRPLYSMSVCSYVQSAVIIASAAFTIVRAARKKG
ncbi:MAG: hypothetical protein IJM45_09915 [Clostridia bacterium]|nr:hypothetical protein [Clostridia bacterium]